MLLILQHLWLQNHLNIITHYKIPLKLILFILGIDELRKLVYVFYCYFLFIFVLYNVWCTPGCPQTQFWLCTQGWPWAIGFPTHTFWVLALEACINIPIFCSAGDGIPTELHFWSIPFPDKCYSTWWWYTKIMLNFEYTEVCLSFSKSQGDFSLLRFGESKQVL